MDQLVSNESQIMLPPALTIDRIDECEELILVQTTSQSWCRSCCCQPTINWVLSEDERQDGNISKSDQKRIKYKTSGWIHEESSFCGRSWSWLFPGCRAQKYVQHSGRPPTSINNENKGFCLCCRCQCGRRTKGLSKQERNSNIVATHEKKSTCGARYTFYPPFPICNCFPLPYLETKNGSDGATMGRTNYVCDHGIFVPKYDVTNSQGEKIYDIRPDTCCMGICVKCALCGHDDGKECTRVPYFIRDPVTLEPVTIRDSDSAAQIDSLHSGWGDECCTMRNKYHVAFPRGATAEQKIILTGSALLINVTMFEQEEQE
jgi:hypothetical protein